MASGEPIYLFAKRRTALILYSLSVHSIGCQMGTPQKWVLKEHGYDCRRATDFITESWPTEASNAPMHMGSFVAYTVSTTLRSSVLLLSVGLDSVFTRNTYSRNEQNPWLLFAHAEENRALAEHITKKWQEMQVPNGQRGRVDQIAKHVVYTYNRETRQFVYVPLECDGNANVRVRIEDLNIWSHPPRDEPLIRAREGLPDFNRQRGDLLAAARSMIQLKIKMSQNPKIPVASLEKKKGKFKKCFTDYHKNYLNLKDRNLIPMSYQFPTLQIELASQQQGVQGDRYGGTFAGVYEANDGEAHHKFPVDGNLQARSLPSEETVFNELMQREGLELDYAEIFTDQ